jgi:hypothetical protein
MKKLMLLICIPVFLLFSCPDGSETDPIDESGVTKKDFWAQSFKDGKFYQLEAGKLAEGTYCTVWVERGAGIDKDGAKKVSDEFDKNVYQKMINAFGSNRGGFSFAAELADINAAEGGKLLILLLDIKDDYQKGVNEAAVGGYFLWSDLFPSESGSNGLAMIYIDTNPGKPGEPESNKTLAHELQHLINEVTSQVLRFDGSQYSTMDTWIDEGLSTAAEYVYSGSHPVDRWGWYHSNGNGTNIKSTIDKGNNFFVWGNHPENPYAEIDDYATAYLFFQWLRIQKGAGVYKDIIGSSNANYLAVTTAAGNNNWGNLLGNWFAANYAPSNSSGYGNDSTLRTLNKHLFTGTTASLYPGEGVFSKISSAYPAPQNSGNINYSLLTSTGVSSETSITNGALLTYNVNTTNAATTPPASGTATGVASVSVDVSVDGRFVSPPVTLSGPYWVSGGDVLRRNGRAGSPSPAGVSRPSIRIAENE